jgi:hypothetical protein
VERQVQVLRIVFVKKRKEKKENLFEQNLVIGRWAGAIQINRTKMAEQRAEASLL